jgi:hypothetical protein
MDIRTRAAGMFTVLFLVSLLLGCAGDKASNNSSPSSAGEGTVAGGLPEPERQPGPASKVIVTSDDNSIPHGCRPRRVADLVDEFVDAFNRGDTERLSRLFFISEGPSPPDFSTSSSSTWSWYSVSEVGPGGKVERGFTTYDQAEMLSYFARRHGHGERLELLRVDVAGSGLLGNPDNVGIIYALTRKADDLPPGLGGPDGVAFGKGSINCERQQIFTWSMETDTGEKRDARHASDWLCARPPGWRPGKAVIACA